MDIELATRGFAAMGAESRMQVLRILVRAGEEGLTVGEIQERLDIAPSTLAHHLKSLSAGGLVSQQRVGRSIVNRPELDHLRELASYILSECCADVAEGARGPFFMPDKTE